MALDILIMPTAPDTVNQRLDFSSSWLFVSGSSTQHLSFFSEIFWKKMFYNFHIILRKWRSHDSSLWTLKLLFLFVCFLFSSKECCWISRINILLLRPFHQIPFHCVSIFSISIIFWFNFTDLKLKCLSI